MDTAPTLLLNLVSFLERYEPFFFFHALLLPAIAYMNTPQLKLHQFLTSPDNLHVRYGVFGARRLTKHVLLFLLGRGEWIEKYEFLYHKIYQDLGYGVVVVDHLGQGGSGGVPAHIDSYDDYLAPLTQLMGGELKGHTYSILAHSMGGLIALYGTLKKQLHPHRLVLCSPLIGLPQKPIPRLIAKPISHFLADSGMSQLSSFVKKENSYPFAKNRLTSDKEKYQLLKVTPFAIPPPTMGWVKASFDATDLIHYDKYLMNLSVPLLIFYGSEEEVVSAASILSWTKVARKLSTSTINCICVDDARHELLFENDRLLAQVFSRVKNFLAHS